MITKEDILHLKSKILPTGAESILDAIGRFGNQVEVTQIVLENVPLLIIGRHGMIARIPVGGVIQKVSQPTEIVDLLHGFFPKGETLYLFVNLPDLPLPSEVTDLLHEVQERAQRKQELRTLLDEALDCRDEVTFYELAQEWQRLTVLETDFRNNNRLHRRH